MINMNVTNTMATEPFETIRPTSGYPGSPIVHTFFDDPTGTWTYLVADPSTSKAMIIDSVLDFDLASGAISTKSVQGLAAFVLESDYRVERIIETHVHADHLTGAHALQQIISHRPDVYIGSGVTKVQENFASTYGYQPADYETAFDGYLEDNGRFQLGDLDVETWALPGHTPDSMGIVVGDCLFAGDSLFLPDVGTARVDFPGGSASALYRSIQRIFASKLDLKVFAGHDYASGRDKKSFSSVSEQRLTNKHVGSAVSEEEFTAMRNTRDAQLGAPRLLHPSLQVNLRAGRLPRPDSAGARYIRIPLKGVTFDTV